MAVTSPPATSGAPLPAVASSAPGRSAAAPGTVTVTDAGRPGIERSRVSPVVFGTILTLAADAMVLATMLAAYFTIKDGAPLWPPGGVSVGTYLPSVITITAAMSAVSAHWMLYAIRGNDHRNAFIALVLTVVLGLAMLNAQWFSLEQSGFGVSDHNYGTLYYLLIGYHVFHLLLGLVALMAVGGRVLSGHINAVHHAPVQAAVYVWQYSNVAWSVILTVLFLFSRHAS